MTCCCGTEVIKNTEQRNNTTVAEVRPVVLVRNVRTGNSIDIRWAIDEELLDLGLDSDE